MSVFGQLLNGYGVDCVRQSVGIYSVEDASGLVLEYRQYQAAVNTLRNSVDYDRFAYVLMEYASYSKGPFSNMTGYVEGTVPLDEQYE